MSSSHQQKCAVSTNVSLNCVACMPIQCTKTHSCNKATKQNHKSIPNISSKLAYRPPFIQHKLIIIPMLTSCRSKWAQGYQCKISNCYTHTAINTRCLTKAIMNIHELMNIHAQTRSRCQHNRYAMPKLNIYITQNVYIST